MSDDRSDEGRSTPSVPDSGESGSEPVEEADAQSDDERPRDPAGVGDPSRDDATGLSGQPDADEFEAGADWSDVDDVGDSSPQTRQDGTRSGPTPADAETRIDAEAGVGSQDRGDDHVDTGPRAGTQAGTGDQRGPGEKFCSNCGSVIDQQAVVCPECGVEQADAQRQLGDSSNDAGVAALLAVVGFFVPILAGAGQFYNGDIGKGVVFTLIQLLNAGLALLFVGLLTYPLVGAVAIWDAYSSANR